jgi:hypothetical protein
VLGFIGIKEGQIDRMLRNNARPALLVFMLIGLAVIGGVVAPAVGREKPISLGLVVFIAGLPVVVLAPFLPHLGPERNLSRWSTAAFIAVGLLAIGILGFLLYRQVTSLKVGTIAVALVLFALGMYGAFKLSAAAKSAKDRPTVSAAFSMRDNKPIVSVGLKASGLLIDEHVVGTVRGFGSRTSNHTLDAFPCGDNCLLVYAFEIGADEGGAIDTKFDVPLTSGDFERISVVAQVCGVPSKNSKNRSARAHQDAQTTQDSQTNKAEPDQCAPTVGKTAYLDFRVPTGPDRPRLNVSVKPGSEGQLQVDIAPTIEGIGGDATISVLLLADLGSGQYEKVATFDVAPTSAGDAALQATSIPVSSSASRICVTGTLVRPGRNPTPSPGCEPGPSTVVYEQHMPPLPLAVAN